MLREKHWPQTPRRGQNIFLGPSPASALSMQLQMRCCADSDFQVLVVPEGEPAPSSPDGVWAFLCPPHRDQEPKARITVELDLR